MPSRFQYAAGLWVVVTCSCTMPNPVFVDTNATRPTSSPTEASGSMTQTSTLEPTTDEPTTATTVDPTVDPTDSTVDPSTSVDPTTEDPPTVDPTTDPTDPTVEPTTESETNQPCEGLVVVDVELVGDTFFLNKNPDFDPLCNMSDCSDLNYGVTASEYLAYVMGEDHKGMFAMRWENPEIPGSELLSASLYLHFSTSGVLLNLDTKFQIFSMPDSDWDIGTRDEAEAENGDSSYNCRKIIDGACIPWHAEPDLNNPNAETKYYAQVDVAANQVVDPATPVEFPLDLEEVSSWAGGSEQLNLLVIPMTDNAPKTFLLFASETMNQGPKLELRFACP
ncbi:MAG: hypothetical protein ACPG4T_06785 [Nannocystaceae bacterium]